MKKILVFLLILVSLVSLSSTAYFFNQNRRAQKLLKDPTAASKEEIKTVTKALSKFMDLPDEEPSVATVLDKEKLKDQPFFARAENGDKVIIYTKSGKAILFRPSTGRIVDIAPINLGESQAPINIVVLNGTATVGLAKTFSASIKAQVTNINVLGEESAKKNDYAKSVVVDISGKKPELAKQMADLIGGVVSVLPEGEVVPMTGTQQVDLLVIVVSPTPTVEIIPTLEISPTPAQ